MSALRGEPHWQDFSWWVMWVLVCIPAGALGGFGLVEFYWEYPEGGYDGGFVGDLVFFGGFLALGQAPFIASFVWANARRSLAEHSPWRRDIAGVVALLTVVAWPVAGFVGWTLGSFAEVPISTALPLYSALGVLAASVRWLVFGVAEGVILALVIFLAVRELRRAVFCAFAWIVASVVGGLLYEAWAATEVAARSNDLNEAIGGFLQGIGVAENVAYVMVPHALFVPVLYGIPTGFVFLLVLHTARRARRNSQQREGALEESDNYLRRNR